MKTYIKRLILDEEQMLDIEEINYSSTTNYLRAYLSDLVDLDIYKHQITNWHIVDPNELVIQYTVT